MDTSHLQKAQGVAGVLFTVSSSLCPSFAGHHGLERCILIQWWSIKFKGAFQWFQAHARCVWKFLCACDLPCQDAGLMLIFERATQLSALTFIQAHRFRSHLSNCSSPFVPNAAPATSQSKSNPTSNPITWDQIIPTKHTSNPIQSNALQVHPNQFKLKSPKKNKHKNSKNSLEIKSQAQQIKGNQSKSVKIKSKPTHPNPTQSTSKPNHQNRHQHQNTHQNQSNGIKTPSRPIPSRRQRL